MTQRPRRQHKTDRLLHQDVIREEARCDMAVAPFDNAARLMDRKWGVDRLPGLVPVPMAEKYGAALHALNEALGANDPAAVTANAENCIKGLKAMDAAAEAAGADKANPAVLEYDLDGFRFGILPGDGMDWPAVKAARPDLRFYSLREVGQALKAYADHVLVHAAKEHFPGAEITAIRPKPDFDWKSGDAIPF